MVVVKWKIILNVCIYLEVFPSTRNQRCQCIRMNFIGLIKSESQIILLCRATINRGQDAVKPNGQFNLSQKVAWKS